MFAKAEPGSANVDSRDAAIFVFADDLGVFPSVRDAESYHEPWAENRVKGVYDRHGNVFHLTAFNARGGGVTIKPVDPPLNRRDEFVERLRDHLDKVAELRPDLLQKEWVAHAPGDDLVRWCTEREMMPRYVERQRPWRFW